MYRIANTCTAEQTILAYKLGAPIRKFTNGDTLTDSRWITFNGAVLYIPTTEEVIGWLEDKGIHVSILFGYSVSDKWSFDLDSEDYIDFQRGDYDTRKEACIAAIDAALEYLTKYKK